MNSLCQKCQLVNSEFLLSRDFDTDRRHDPSATSPQAAAWHCHQDEQGKRYRQLVHHDVHTLQESAKNGCKLCTYLIQPLDRFAVNGFFPIIQGQCRVSISETGSFELIPPPESPWGDTCLAWEEIGTSVEESNQAREGRMRHVAGTSALCCGGGQTNPGAEQLSPRKAET